MSNRDMIMSLVMIVTVIITVLLVTVYPNNRKAGTGMSAQDWQTRANAVTASQSNQFVIQNLAPRR